jgi:hypothetical protein
MTTTLSIQTTLSAFDLCRENSKDEIIQLIMGLDFEIAEADFTETLILKLATGLAADSKTSTMIDIGTKISNMEGYAP